MKAGVRKALLFAAASALLAGCGGRTPANGPGGGVSVTGAWVRSTPPGASAGALYLTLHSAAGDRLIGASVPRAIAAAVEMHRTTRDAAGRLGMKRVDWVELPPGIAVTFKPGGSHLMLVGLVRPLAAGDTLVVKLRFGRAKELELRAPVRAD